MVKEKPLSWKWRILIAVIALFLVCMVLILSPWGFRFMKGKLVEAYEECPPEERATHWSADWWLRLAWWEGHILFRERDALQMYQEFLAIMPSTDKGGKTSTFWEWYDVHGTPRFNGMLDPKTKTGWGILHPRACEAYYQYWDLFSADSSRQMYSIEGERYRKLFVDIYPKLAQSKGKPHPQFYVYWPEIQRQVDRRFVRYDEPPPKPPDYPGPEAKE